LSRAHLRDNQPIMAESTSATTPALNTEIETGRFDEKEIQPAETKPATTTEKAKVEEEEEEDEDIVRKLPGQPTLCSELAMVLGC
jgi:hypothetical protein